MTGHRIAPICRALSIGRSTVYRAREPRGRRYLRADDRIVTAQVRSVIRTRATYGYRRVTALVNRAFETGYNPKRVRRVMELNGWNLPRPGRRRNGRAHTGRVRRDTPNERWSSDMLEIACWNSEIVVVAFALDCCDREVLSHVAQPRDLVAGDIQRLMRGAPWKLVLVRSGPGARFSGSRIMAACILHSTRSTWPRV